MQVEFTGYHTVRRYLQTDRDTQRERERERERERRANSEGVQRVSSGFYLSMDQIVHVRRLLEAREKKYLK